MIDVVGIVASITLVAVGIFAAYIYDGQLREMRHTNLLTQRALDASNDTLRETLEKMQAQINAANTANNLSRQSIIASQAASVIIESPRPTPFSKDIALLRHQGIYLYFANVGKTKSGSFEVNAILTRRGLPAYSVLGAPQKRGTTAEEIMPGERMPNGIPGFRTDDVYLSFDTNSFTEKDIALINSLNEVAEISGSFSYGDGFGGVHRQLFCFLYAVFPRHVFPESGASTGGGEGSWGLCSDMRRYVVKAEEWKIEDEKGKK